MPRALLLLSIVELILKERVYKINIARRKIKENVCTLTSFQRSYNVVFQRPMCSG